MVETLSLDIPQLKVLAQQSYQSISKEWEAEIEKHFLWTYLSNKTQELSVRHFWLNEIIREIYLVHFRTMEKRVANEFYPQDEHHHRQLFLSKVVCENISAITGELAYCLYFMKFIKDFKMMPPKKDVAFALSNLSTCEEFKEDFLPYRSFIKLTDTIRYSYHLNTVFPASKLLLTEKSPVFFIVTKEEQIEKHSLGNYLNDYNGLFTNCIKCL